MGFLPKKEIEMSDVQDDKKAGPDEKYCSSCGSIIKKEAVICPKCGVQQKAMGNNEVSTNWLTVLLLCVFLGTIGAHNFYVGKKGRGILMLALIVGGVIFAFAGVGFVAIGVACILWIIDLIKILTGKFTNGAGQIIEKNK